MTTVDGSSTWEIAGRTVDLPVRIRHARQWAASWLVPAPTAQALIDYSGLEVAQPLPGRAVFSLAFVDYLDGDLDSYHEVALSLLVRPHDRTTPAEARAQLRAFGRGDVAAFIHDLPVDREFTRAAGTTIWGYPKWLAEITFTQLNGATACSVFVDGELQFIMQVRDSGPLPFPSQMPPTYSWRDGILRRTEWEIESTGGSSRPGGARLRLGTSGPLVRTLRRLNLPRHALMSSATPHLESTFGPAQLIEDAQ